MFCYDKTKKGYGLAGIAFNMVSAKFSKGLGRFLEINEIGQFGLEVRDVKVTIFSSLDTPTQRIWIDSIITVPTTELESEMLPIWTRGDKIKKKRHLTRNTDSGCSGIYCSLILNWLLYLFTLAI